MSMMNPHAAEVISYSDPIGEVWVPVPIAPGYQVSNHGAVGTIWGDIVKPSYVCDGMVYYTLHHSGEVVFDDAGWKLFLSAIYVNPPSDAQPQFQSSSTYDLSMDNLRWVYFDRAAGYYKPFYEQRDWPVGGWRLYKNKQGRIRARETGEIFLNASQAAKHLGINRSNLSKHLAGMYGAVGGYTFDRLD